MKQHRTARLIGSCVIAAAPLTVVMWATLELLRHDRSPLRNVLSEYLVGRLSFLGAAAASILAVTFLVLLVGLLRSVRPSALLTASCVLLGVVAVSLGLSAAFPTDASFADGSRPASTGARIIHLLSGFRFYALLIALLFTLPGAYKRDERWQPLSRVTLFLGALILALGAGSMLAPLDWRGLVQRGAALAILAWFLLTGWRLRQTIPSAHGTAA